MDLTKSRGFEAAFAAWNYFASFSSTLPDRRPSLGKGLPPCAIGEAARGVKMRLSSDRHFKAIQDGFRPSYKGGMRLRRERDRLRP